MRPVWSLYEAVTRPSEADETRATNAEIVTAPTPRASHHATRTDASGGRPCDQRGVALVGVARCRLARERGRVRRGRLVDGGGHDEYVAYHADVWPGVLKMIHDCNIRNYSIYHKDGLLFAYFEYVGDDFEADMAKMAADPETQRWWDIMMPMQAPLETRAEGEWWANMEEVFHTD